MTSANCSYKAVVPALRWAAVIEFFDLQSDRLKIEWLFLFRTGFVDQRDPGFGSGAPAQHCRTGDQLIAELSPGKGW